MSSLKSYVISLPSALERRKHIISEFSKHRVSFQFFDALSPSLQFEQLISKHIPSLASSNLTGGEKGCLMSHLLLWYKCVEENCPYIAIFEDDIFLGKNSCAFLEENKWLDERFKSDDVFIIRLETFLQKVSCENTYIASYIERDFLKLKSTHFGTAGYIISFGAAKYFLDLLKNIPVEDIAPIDELIFNRFLEKTDIVVYQLSPAICIQELQFAADKSVLTSQLELERSKVRLRKEGSRKNRKTFKERVIHILTKPKRIIQKRKKVREQMYQAQVIIYFK